MEVLVIIIYIFLLCVIGSLIPIKLKKNSDEYYDDSWYISFWWVFLTIITCYLFCIYITYVVNRQKVVRKKIKKEIENYEKEKQYHFSDGNEFSRVYLDKEKKIICLYVNGEIKEIKFDNLLSIETYKDLNMHEIKILTKGNDVSDTIISLKYIKRYIRDNKSNGYLSLYSDQAEKALEYVLSNNEHSNEIVIEEKLSFYDEIKNLKKLYDEGILTKEEYENKKKDLLNS